MKIKQTFNFRNETDFMLSLNPQIKEIFKVQQEQTKKRKKGEKEKKIKEEKEENSKMIERVEFIEFTEDKQKDGIVKVKDEQVMGKK